MTTVMTFNQNFTIVLAIFSTPNSLVVKAKNVGFSLDLVHRDSPKSLFYNPSLTPSQRVATALNRSLQWYDYFRSGSASVISDHGEFHVTLSIGTLPVETLAIVDTGSDLDTMRALHLLFQAKGYYLYATTNTCQYSINYVDKSFTRGSLATETLTLVSPQVHLRFPDTIFGCGQANDVGKFDDIASGIVGLGGRQESLISQWSRSIGGISVGSRRIVILELPPSGTELRSEGNMIIDSGSTLTELKSYVYNQVESAGADLKLNPSNTFVRRGAIRCVTFASTDNHVVLGNLAQVNLFVSFDLEKKLVSFEPTDCENL
ncbi:hypothetical protein LguiA_010587 [Lonicera macranthoides]